MHSNCKTSDPKINTMWGNLLMFIMKHMKSGAGQDNPPPPLPHTIKIASTSKDQERQKVAPSYKMDSTAFYGPHNHLKPKRAAFA